MSNYRLIVARRKFDVLKTNITKYANITNKYASFKDIKFPRGNYQTDSSETETLYPCQRYYDTVLVDLY